MNVSEFPLEKSLGTWGFIESWSKLFLTLNEYNNITGLGALFGEQKKIPLVGYYNCKAVYYIWQYLCRIRDLFITMGIWVIDFKDTL